MCVCICVVAVGHHGFGLKSGSLRKQALIKVHELLDAEVQLGVRGSLEEMAPVLSAGMSPLSVSEVGGFSAYSVHPGSTICQPTQRAETRPLYHGPCHRSLSMTTPKEGSWSYLSTVLRASTPGSSVSKEEIGRHP